jgi:hypothetical protein
LIIGLLIIGKPTPCKPISLPIYKTDIRCRIPSCKPAEQAKA